MPISFIAQYNTNLFFSDLPSVTYAEVAKESNDCRKSLQE